MNIDELLSKVRKPSRYLGGEINSHLKPWETARVRWCLAFPDVYEIGMSHLGLQILHSILNSQADVLADLVFTPWVDMEAAMRELNAPLWGLTTRRPVREFDVLGITLPYELTATNILTILDLAGLPFNASDRGDDMPLVIGGGVGAFNPEPVAQFFDAIVLGDGEEVVLQISEVIRSFREGTEPLPYGSNHGGDNTVGATLCGRPKILNELAKIQGVYIPTVVAEFTLPKLGSLGKVNFATTKVAKLTISDLNSAPHLPNPIIPFMKVVHDRVGVEIQRGCTRGCRFCQAGFIYRPLRKRSLEKVLEIADDGLTSTGHEDLSFLSLSAGDYEELPAMLKIVAEKYKKKWTNISLPSLRVESLTPEILATLARSLHGGFTLAPEAATERLRAVINKGNTEADLFATIEKVFASGWRQLKLYFMIGLPTETLDDVRAIADLTHKAFNIGKKHRRDATITVSISTFVPKPHTPFQWAKQLSIEETIERQDILKAGLRRHGIELKWHNAWMSFLEGIFSRGDKKLGTAVVKAWENGARFDAWDDQLKFDVWMNAFKDSGISPQDYLRERDLNEPLPWDHLFVELDRDFLKQEHERSLSGEMTEDCNGGRCHQCGLQVLCHPCEETMSQCRGGALPPPNNAIEYILWPAQRPATTLRHSLEGWDDKPQTCTLNFTFTKTGDMRWLSHLELMQLFRRAFRRADLPLVYTEGFHPHMKLVLERALKVGAESDNEHGKITLSSPIDTQYFMNFLNENLPEGIRITMATAVEHR